MNIKEREWLETIKKSLRVIGAEREKLKAEVEGLKVEQAATICAWEEYSRWPDLPSVPYGVIRHEDGRMEQLALRPEQINGLLQGIEKHVRDCLPFGVSAVKARQEIDGVRFRLEAAEAREAALESDMASLTDCINTEARENSARECEHPVLDEMRRAIRGIVDQLRETNKQRIMEVEKLWDEKAALVTCLRELMPSINAELAASTGLSRDYPHLYNMLHNWHEDICALLPAQPRQAAPDPSLTLIRKLRDALQEALAASDRQLMRVGFLTESKRLIATATQHLREHGADSPEVTDG